MDIDKKIHFAAQVFGLHILLEQFQNKSGFETEHGKTCRFSPQIGSYTPTPRDKHLHLLASRNHFYTIFCMISTNKVLRWGVTANFLNLQLSWRISWQLKNGNTEIHIYRKLICHKKVFSAAITICFSFVFFHLQNDAKANFLEGNKL